MKYLIIYASVIGAVSVITFFVYFSDKMRAKKNKWRIRESVLLGLGICGGALGALIAMNVIRHKTKHTYFWVINTLALMAHAAIAVVLFMLYV